MPPRGKVLTPIVTYMMIGVCLSFVIASCAPLWKVGRLTFSPAGINRGNFWEFIRELPAALVGRSAPQDFTSTHILLPRVYLWANIRTTLLVFVVGTCIGYVVWWFRHGRASQG
jgi:hypothetical protein